jgi:hypothetical protein
VAQNEDLVKYIAGKIGGRKSRPCAGRRKSRRDSNSLAGGRAEVGSGDLAAPENSQPKQISGEHERAEPERANTKAKPSLGAGNEERSLTGSKTDREPSHTLGSDKNGKLKTGSTKFDEENKLESKQNRSRYRAQILCGLGEQHTGENIRTGSRKNRQAQAPSREPSSGEKSSAATGKSSGRTRSGAGARKSTTAKYRIARARAHCRI